MLDAPLDPALTRATADVMERMFFTESAPAPDGAAVESGPHLAARMAFDGDLSGALMLALPVETAVALAADFLGLDADEPPKREQVHEVVCELTNMICGHTLSALEIGGLRLATPCILDDTEWAVPESACRRTFELGYGRLTVALAFQERRE